MTLLSQINALALVRQRTCSRYSQMHLESVVMAPLRGCGFPKCFHVGLASAHWPAGVFVSIPCPVEYVAELRHQSDKVLPNGECRIDDATPYSSYCCLTYGGAAMALILIRDEARARHLAYLTQQLNSCPMGEPSSDDAAVEDMVERAYWGQTMSSLRRGLDESQQQEIVRH